MSGRPDVVGGHYRVGDRIGEGSFGVIYAGVNELNGKRVAMKFEPWKSASPQLKDEYRTYKQLTGCPGVPTIYYFGQEAGFNCLVMELLGPSLEDVFDRCGRKFSVGTVCLLAMEMISRIQTVHEKGMIYRDIKPDNFLLGPRDNGTVYIVDFGMAKYYMSQVTGRHIPYSEKKSLSGTARYMSINTHRGREQSRRDDLEALGHVLLYFLRGSLPWQGIKAATNKEKYEKIGEKKQAVPVDELCDNFPEEFERYLKVVRSLDFEDRPNYEFLKGLFRGLLAKMEPEETIPDWRRRVINVFAEGTNPESTGEQPKKDQLQDASTKRQDSKYLQTSPTPAQSPGPKSPIRSPRCSPHRSPNQQGEAAQEAELSVVESTEPRAEEQQICQQQRKQSFWRRMFCI